MTSQTRLRVSDLYREQLAADDDRDTCGMCNGCGVAYHGGICGDCDGYGSHERNDLSVYCVTSKVSEVKGVL